MKEYKDYQNMGRQLLNGFRFDRIISDPLKEIDGSNWNPHYSNPYWNDAHTIFLLPGYKTVGQYEMVDGLEYVYSDRLRQWYKSEEYDKAWAGAKELHPLRTAAFIQEYMRRLMGNPAIELVHILAGVNVSNGYSYQVYGYNLTEAAQS